MDYAIQTHDLCKIIDEQVILSNVSMNVKKGEIYGFLGANGAGKTTLMKTLLRLIKPTSGDIKLFDSDKLNSDNSIFSRIGSIIETPIFYQNLTARGNLELHCDYMGISYENIDNALEATGISKTKSKSVKSFSLGMKQRLALAEQCFPNPKY